jgi:hypothetical protein
LKSRIKRHLAEAVEPGLNQEIKQIGVVHGDDRRPLLTDLSPGKTTIAFGIFHPEGRRGEIKQILVLLRKSEGDLLFHLRHLAGSLHNLGEGQSSADLLDLGLDDLAFDGTGYEDKILIYLSYAVALVAHGLNA